MRKYEAFYILDPDLTDEATNAINDKLKNVVADNGGSVVSNVPWGKKKLAYPVKKHTRGQYVLMEFGGDPTLVAELERNMRLDERVIKFITVKLQESFDPEKEAESRLPATSRFGEEEDAEAGVAGYVSDEEVESFDEGMEDEGDQEDRGEEE